MTRALTTAFGVALTVSVAAAQPMQAPVGRPTTTDEKAGTKLENDASAGGAVSADDEREASIDFRQGNDHLDNGLFLQAVDKYNAALAHWDHPASHYNLALALINLDRPLEVYDHLMKAIAHGPDPLDKDKYDHAKEYLRLVQSQLADLEVSCDEPGAKVAVDGKEVFVAPGKYTAKILAGKHSFVADKQGYNARIIAPFVGPGELVRIELKLYTAEELTRYRRRWDKAWLPYGVIGAGALFGLVGGGLELSAGSSFKDYDATVARCNLDNTTPNGGCSVTPDLQRMRDSGNAKRTAGLVMYGVAGGAIAVGAALAYINRREEYQIRAEDLAGQRVSVTPIVAPGMAGALVQGRF
jgi:tetratricopeptide (TPR) repeat protein